MKTTTRTASAAPAVKLPTPIEEAIKTATETVENVAAETKVAAAKVEKRVKSAAKSAAASAKKTGRAIANDPKGFSVKLGHDIQKKAVEVKDGVTKETKRFADEVSGRITKAIESTVAKGLHRFNVPSRQELRNLTKKVDELGKKIDALQKGRATRTTRTARKAAK